MGEFPEDWELLSFFEQEPDSIDEHEAELFGSWSFTVALEDGDTLVFEVGQNFRDPAVSPADVPPGLGAGRTPRPEPGLT